jgi:hypothetical protein
VASRVRFLPHSEHPRTVCLRVELYGCRYTGGVTAYAAPPGDEFSPGVRLEDIAYDGLTPDDNGGGGGGGSGSGGGGSGSGGGGGGGDAMLTGGLGLLTDGQPGGRLVFNQQGLASGN